MPKPLAGHGQADFLSFFIVFLICGSILGLEKKLLLKSFAGYLPAIFGGLIGAAVLGVAGGLVFGIAPDMILLNYVLPIMGGGNGAGAVPLSQIYETVTGDQGSQLLHLRHYDPDHCEHLRHPDGGYPEPDRS